MLVRGISALDPSGHILRVRGHPHMICGQQAQMGHERPKICIFLVEISEGVCLWVHILFGGVRAPKRAGRVHSVCQNKFEPATTLRSRDFAFWVKNKSAFSPPPPWTNGGHPLLKKFQCLSYTRYSKRFLCTTYSSLGPIQYLQGVSCTSDDYLVLFYWGTSPKDLKYGVWA